MEYVEPETAFDIFFARLGFGKSENNVRLPLSIETCGMGDDSPQSASDGVE